MAKSTQLTRREFTLASAALAAASLARADEQLAATVLSELKDTATHAEGYIKDHLFDPDGLMYSYVDIRTGKPFAEEYVASFKEHVRRATAWSVHHRADSDPVTYWSYEDTVAAAGFYIQALVLKHDVSGDESALQEAFRIWDRYRQVYYASQVHGIGCFLRPYGGFKGGFAGMNQWMEPLGTDQAGPLLCGQYALWKHADGEQKNELADIMVKTLSWYEQQGFRYLWYKSLVHGWRKGGHAGSYYLPAIAFAAKVTGDHKWRKLLQEKLPLAQGSGAELGGSGEGTFKWGSDLIMLADLLGPEFEQAFPRSLLADSYEQVLKHLATFTLPGLSAPAAGGARQRPTELGFYHLCGLAGVGHPGAAEKVLSVLSASKKVPEDFTVFLYEDHDKLPQERYTQLQARAIGRPLVLWYRNYWIVRTAMKPRNG